MCACIGLGPHDARAQYDSLRIQPLSSSAQAKGGVQQIKAGHVNEAIPLLEAAVTTDSAAIIPSHGAVVYWLGEAYARSGDSARARTTWYRGFHHLDHIGRFDARLADAYLRTLTRTQVRNERLQAVDAYAALLGRVRPDTSEALQSLFRRRVSQIAPLMSDDVFERTVKGERDEPTTWSFRAGAGDTLRAWWKGLDPFPNTPENERLEEHVTRLVHARQAFSCSERVSALDARGTVHLRLGAPFKRRPLRYKDMDFFKEVYRFGVNVSPSSFPESELWIYPQIDKSGFYLFAEEGSSDCFELATANDLLPGTFKMQRGASERGLNIAYSSLMAMRAIYRELALYHINFSGRYAEIANYADWQEMEATRQEMQQIFGTGGGGANGTEVGAGVGQTRTVFSNRSLGIAPPNQFVTQIVSRAEREDREAEKRREENMPRQYTALHGDTPQLPVALRTARFLNDDGTTRTEVYWGVSAADARLESDDEEDPPPSLIRFSAIRQNDDRSQTRRQNRNHELPSDPTEQGQALVPAPLTFKSDDTHHLTLQWAQHRLWRKADGSTSGLGPKHRYTLARADSLDALHSAGDRLEMSDLKALSLPDTALASLADPAEQATPYPFRSITVDTPLLLAFEIYHLTFGADDRTQYTVDYEVEGETRRGWTRLLRGQDTQRTRTTMTREGTSRRSDEQILLDLSEIDHEEEQDVRVTVRVTDEETGETVTRSLDFVLHTNDSDDA